jgi:pimeloyl-ACP methyl ester carboxylesterase
VKPALQLAFGRQCCVSDLHRGRFDVTGATGRATGPAWCRAPLDRCQERCRPGPPASGRDRLWDAGAATARLAPALVALAPGRQATQRPLPAAIPDLRGFGWSEAPGSGYSPTGFADDAVALLDALDLASADVIGHDWSGFAGFLYSCGGARGDRGPRV